MPVRMDNAINGDSWAGSNESTKVTISKVLTQIKRFQEKVRKHIDGNYVEFLSIQSSFDLFMEEGESLIFESENLLQTVGKEGEAALYGRNIDLVSCIQELQETTLGLNMCYRILKIEDLFQCVEESNSAKEYLVTLDLLGKLRELIYNIGISEDEQLFQKCECYETIKIKYHIQSNILKQNLQSRFERLLQFTTKTYTHIKCVTLRVSKDVCQLQDTVVALFQARYNPMEMCDFLMENCLEPLIVKPVLLEYKDDSSDYIELSLSYSLKDLSNNLSPPYKQVFQNIEALLQCLNSINLSVSRETHVFSIIGDYLKQRFFILLIEECLLHAIPETMDEYKESSLVEDVLHFEQFLVDNFFINAKKDRALNEFANKFDSYFKTRFCNKVLENAKNIMTKDLQDMVFVGEKTAFEIDTSSPFGFPCCMISKNTLELVKIMECLLRQLDESEKEFINFDIIKLIPLILNFYVTEVPKIHEKLIEKIPQQSVLFYNNCMFLAYWITNNSKNHIPTSPALVKTLELTGIKYFNIQLSLQRKIITDILRELDLSETHSLGTTPFKLVRQCLRQLELLKNVWQNVLPDAIYIKTFYDFLDEVCTEIIRRIFSMEDISATVANELSELIEVVLSKVPLLFKEQSEMANIKSWAKLSQLKNILNASLQEILDLWGDGAGILTNNYKSDEIRHLIRAIFQNTDRRAKALTKII